MRTRSAYLLLVGILLVSTVLESTKLAEAIPHFILDYDYSQDIKKFVVELVDGLHQADISLLDQIEEL